MKLFRLTAFLLSLTPLAFSQPPVKPAADTAMDHAKPPVPPSKSLSVTFEGKTLTLSVKDLLDMPQVTVHVHNAHRNADEDYTGPLVADVLTGAGLAATHETEQKMLRSSLIATATDHYFVVFSIAEVEPSFSTGKVIVAVMKSGLPDAEGGLIQLINTADAKPARWVHGLTELSVMTVAASTPAKSATGK